MSQELRDSIEHWRRLRACKTVGEFKIEGFNSTSCQLCMNRVGPPDPARPGDAEVMCEMESNPCPIYLRTERCCCDGTPYAAAARLLTVLISDVGPVLLEDVHGAIDDEIAFLEEVNTREEEKRDDKAD